MDAEKRWRIEVSIDEHENRTRARARLLDVEPELVGFGMARLNPADRNVPAIGDELAVARALSDLMHKLLDAAARDIQTSTHRPAFLYG